MQQVFTEYPALYGTDDILYHIGRLLEEISGKQQDTPAIIDGLKTAIGNDVNLQNVLRGTNVSNYGGSLLENGNNENGISTNWSNQNSHLGNILTITAPQQIFNNSKVKTPNKAIIKLSFDYSLNTSIQLCGLITFRESDNVSVGNNPYFYLEASQNFSKTTKYLCINFDTDLPIYSKFFFGGWANANVLKIRNLNVQYVSLGEPVPYTLPYLPTGQMVYDPATNDVGRFNGTNINWFM